MQHRDAIERLILGLGLASCAALGCGSSSDAGSSGGGSAGVSANGGAGPGGAPSGGAAGLPSAGSSGSPGGGSGGAPSGGSGASGAGGASGGSGPGGAAGAGPSPEIPGVNGACPELATGSLEVLGTAVELWVGTTPGPLYFYWHGTGQDSTEVERGLPGVVDAVAQRGGIVASFETTNGEDTNTGNGVWHTGDFVAADQILACGVARGLVDTRRIYTAGYSAGGLQACAMVVQRGGYLAAAICYSGGAATVRGTPEDTRHLPPTLLLHGAEGSDRFILDFNRASATWAAAYSSAGGFAIDCDDGGDHIASALTRMGFDGRATSFLEAHPFGVSPEPYAAGLPADWPEFCRIVE